MKKLLLLSALSTLLFSTQINFNKTFSKNVSSDELTTRITIKLTRGAEDDISPILNKYNEFIKQSVGVQKQRGVFSINPKYVYKNGQSKIVGYNGNLSYNITSKSSKNMNYFIKELLYSKDEKNLSIIISSLRWKISDELKESTSNNLRLEAIVWSKDYVAKLSNKLNTQCVSKNISINQSNSYSRPQLRMMPKSLSADAINSDISIPVESKNKISLRVNYKMECK